MYGTEQTDSATSEHHLIVVSWTQRYRVTTMKHSLPMEIIKVKLTAVQDSTRIQGGNWNMQGFRRSGHVHDEGECQMSIADFMTEQRPLRDSDDA
jgi:hypothetical protein